MHVELGIWYQVKAIKTHTAEDIFDGNMFSILVVKIHLYIWVALYFMSYKIISSSTPPLFVVILLIFSMERANRSQKWLSLVLWNFISIWKKLCAHGAVTSVRKSVISRVHRQEGDKLLRLTTNLRNSHIPWDWVLERAALQLRWLTSM